MNSSVHILRIDTIFRIGRIMLGLLKKFDLFSLDIDGYLLIIIVGFKLNNSCFSCIKFQVKIVNLGCFWAY